MSSGPEHYREAERLLAAVVPAMNEAAQSPASAGDVIAAARLLAAQAHVHAMLALVAATVGNAEQDFDKVDEHVAAWAAVLT